MKTNEIVAQSGGKASKPLLGIVVADLKKRVIEKPYSLSWKAYGQRSGIREEGKINYDGLNDHEKMVLYIFAWNLSGKCVRKKSVMKAFNWTAYKVSKMYRELKEYGLESEATFSEETGLLTGRGYHYYHA